MNKSVSVKIRPQFIDYVHSKYNGFNLHRIQEILYNYDELAEINILIAPTGTGKSYGFALPIVYKKNKTWRFKGMIVSPTNALIEDIKENLEENFSLINIGNITGKVLNDLNKKGPERFREILRIIDKNDLIITNPDIINYALYGGYNCYGVKVREFISELFEKINFIIYDEYHLYDEEQIANILSLILLKESLIQKKIKFIFTSATPESGFEEFLRKHNMSYYKYEEKIGREGRKIHGKINLNFIRGDIVDYIQENRNLIEEYIKKDEKILIIFDTLKKLKEFKGKNLFSNKYSKELSGYTTRQETKSIIEDSNITLGTNKIEVGVNLDINICFMEEGRYLKNFLQRFGRVARGNNDGEVFVFCEKIIPLSEKLVEKEYEYYDFLRIYQEIKKDKEFYTESLPKYLGTFLYAIYDGIRDYSLKNLFFGKVELENTENFYFHKMRIINQKIKDLNNYGNHPYIKLWTTWWDNFLGSFRYFRENKPVVKIKDLDENIITEYDFEWILNNKNIIKIETINDKKIYVVEGLKYESEPFLYITNCLLPHSTNYFSKNEYYKPKELFEASLKESYEKYKEDKSEFSKKCKEIILELKDLTPVITNKRLCISDIETNDFSSRLV